MTKAAVAPFTQWLFPLGSIGQVGAERVRDELRGLMKRWGRPEAMRFDNGTPWGHESRMPTTLALWLVGLGIQLQFGRPRQSTDNAVVERGHGVLAKWVEPQRCSSVEELQERLTYFVHLQRCRYPHRDGRSRAEVYPELEAQRSPYCPSDEERLWSLDRVLAYLKRFDFTRKVEKNGRITLLTREYSVGRDYARQHVSVRLDVHTQQWVVCDAQGEELKRFTAVQLNYTTISQMRLRSR